MECISVLPKYLVSATELCKLTCQKPESIELDGLLQVQPPHLHCTKEQSMSGGREVGNEKKSKTLSSCICCYKSNWEFTCIFFSFLLPGSMLLSKKLHHIASLTTLKPTSKN